MSQNYKTSPDYILLFIVAALVSVGLLMVFSTSPLMAMKLGDPFYYLKRHLIALFFGSIAMYAGFRMDHQSLKNWSSQIIFISLALLVMILIPGIGVKMSGANRWLNLGLFSFQPAEIAKLALIIFLAKELANRKIDTSVLPLLGILASIITLVLLEPDMGTSVALFMIASSMFFIAGTNIKYIWALLASGFISLIILSRVAPYRIKRIAAYIDPWNDPKGSGYQIIQSLIAVGTGGTFGLGLGGSRQKFYYLSQNYSDFIYAVLCEEMGLVGAVGVIILFALFISRGHRIIRNAPDHFSMLLAGGIVSWIGFQAFLNMSVVVGLLPTTGIPLPFISYGGTSLIMTLFSVGLLLNISQYTRST